jgi:hypothetical protein
MVAAYCYVRMREGFFPVRFHRMAGMYRKMPLVPVVFVK